VKTPCHADPEKWVGEDLDLRVEAVMACRSCPLFDACAKEARLNPPTHGVWGGVDYSRNSVTAGRISECQHCGVTVVSKKAGRPRRYCGADCMYRARYERTQESRDCELCGKEFRKNGLSKRQWAGRRFCSQKCFGLSKSVAA
jgi:hypothetical protein